jgi:hypothetical protein
VRVLAFILHHRGLSQEARPRAEQLAREIDHDWAAAPTALPEAPFKDESAVLTFLRSLD